MTPSPRINLERLKTNLLELGHIGFRDSDAGVYRMGFSDADMQGRRWLLDKFEQAGISARFDGAGNVIGRAWDSEKPAIAIGSHLDTVPAGGLFDGALGVLAGLECLQVLREQGLRPVHPVEVIGFAEEEGRFGGMLGSQAMSGQTTHEWLMNTCDPEGNRLQDCMRKQGLEPLEALNAYRERTALKAFLELHIEQGPVLDKIGKPIGIVDTISGVYVWHVHLRGKADHAGTAPMDMRSDAFMGLADFAHELPRIIEEEGTEKSRLTVGKVELKPGAPHTVAAEALFTLVGRDQSGEVMRNLALACRKTLSAIARRHHLMFEYLEMTWLEPQACHPEVMDLFKRQAEKLGLEYEVLPSGAGHDTQCMARITPAGMVFVPSVGGISHAPDELTHWTDVERGANLLLHALVEHSGATAGEGRPAP